MVTGRAGDILLTRQDPVPEQQPAERGPLRRRRIVGRRRSRERERREARGWAAVLKGPIVASATMQPAMIQAGGTGRRSQRRSR